MMLSGVLVGFKGSTSELSHLLYAELPAQCTMA